MKSTMMVMAVVLSVVGFLTFSFAGMLKPVKPGEAQQTGKSIYKARKTQLIIPRPVSAPKIEAKTNEKIEKRINVEE
ncbi:MAG: hypothetical protein WC676_00985 [Candidatus Omnitrophota bacterium]